MYSSANNSTGSSQNRQSKSRKMPKVRGISVNHPNSRTQKALAKALDTANLDAAEKAKVKKRRNAFSAKQLTALKAKLASNLANMTQHVNNLNKHSKNTAHLELAKETLNEFLKLYFEIRKTKVGDPRGNKLEELMWNELEHSNDNTDTLARISLKKFVTILTKILNFEYYYHVLSDEMEKSIKHLMWKQISK